MQKIYSDVHDLRLMCVSQKKGHAECCELETDKLGTGLQNKRLAGWLLTSCSQPERINNRGLEAPSVSIKEYYIYSIIGLHQVAITENIRHTSTNVKSKVKHTSVRIEHKHIWMESKQLLG